MKQLQPSKLRNILVSCFCGKKRTGLCDCTFYFDAYGHTHSHLSPTSPFPSFLAPVTDIYFYIFNARVILSGLGIKIERKKRSVFAAVYLLVSILALSNCTTRILRFSASLQNTLHSEILSHTFRGTPANSVEHAASSIFKNFSSQ